MKEKIEKELGVLIGLSLVDAGRVADLEWFSFGKHFETLDSRGNKKLVSEYAIHIQCTWRITGLNKIIVASRDRYVPRDGWDGDEEDFEWDCHGENLCDQRIDEFFQRNKDLKVSLIEADNYGSCRLVLNGGFTLEIFPDDSDVEEHWRLFQPYKKFPHFVVTGEGITD